MVDEKLGAFEKWVGVAESRAIAPRLILKIYVTCVKTYITDEVCAWYYNL
jgi:hypothetical protein